MNASASTPATFGTASAAAVRTSIGLNAAIICSVRRPTGRPLHDRLKDLGPMIESERRIRFDRLHRRLDAGAGKTETDELRVARAVYPRTTSTGNPGGSMRFLLASAGITNTTIHDALVDLLGKPIAESNALCIPTGVQPFPGGPSHVYRFISGSAPGPMCELGWKSLGVLELTALPSIKDEFWIPEVQETDALLVWGGSPLYLCYWMRQSGLADLLPLLRRETVYVGTSGGAMVATPDFGGTTYDESDPLTGSDRALGLVDFSVFPHLDREDGIPASPLAEIEAWAAGLSVPAYAIDDQTAINVTDGNIEVVSEGHWKLFTP
jgi:dipeptidase E